MGNPIVVKCHVCRSRKVKCDCMIPSCSQCLKSNLTCTGYERTLRWRAPKTVLSEKPPITFAEDHPTITRAPSKRTSERYHREINPRKFRSHQRLLNYTPSRVELCASTQASLSTSQHRLAFLGDLQDRWMPPVTQAQGFQGTILCNIWLGSACTLSSLEEAEPLLHSLLAISLALLSDSQADQRVLTESIRHYSQAVRGLKNLIERESRQHIRQEMKDISALTCFVCASFEMIANSSLHTAYQHFSGIRAILQWRGIASLTSQSSRAILYEYRPIDICFCLLDRRSSFLSRAAWIDLPSILEDAHATAPLQRLLNIAYLVPPLMERFDLIQNKISDHHSFPESVLHARSRTIQQILLPLLRSAQFILKKLKTWESGLQNQDERVQLYLCRFSSWNNATRDPDESLYGKIFPVSYTFPSFELAAALIYHEAVKTFVLELIGDITQYIENRSERFPSLVVAGSPTMIEVNEIAKSGNTEATSSNISPRSVADLRCASIDAASRICSSLEYFFEKDMKVIGRMVSLFPFETAHRIFKKDGSALERNRCRRELLFCDMVVERLQREGIPTTFPSSHI